MKFVLKNLWNEEMDYIYDADRNIFMYVNGNLCGDDLVKVIDDKVEMPVVLGVFNDYVKCQVNYYDECIWRSDDVPIGFVIVTNDCNLRCKFCYAYAGSDSGKVFDVRFLEKLLKLWGREYVDRLSVSGGEPLLYKDVVKEIGRFAKELIIFTNGTMLDEDFVKWVMDNKHKLFVSVDYEKEGYHGSGVYDKLKYFDKKFGESFWECVEFSNCYPVGELNIRSFGHWISSIGEKFSSVESCKLNFIDDGDINIEELSELGKKQVIDIFEGRLNIMKSVFSRFIENVVDYFKYGFVVTSCDFNFTLNYYGDIVMCQEHASFIEDSKRYKFFKIGNVNEFSSVTEVKSRLYDFVMKRIAGKFKCDIGLVCEAKWFCGGRCWANRVGFFNKYLCDVYRVLFPYFLVLFVNCIKVKKVG